MLGDLGNQDPIGLRPVEDRLHDVRREVVQMMSVVDSCRRESRLCSTIATMLDLIRSVPQGSSCKRKPIDQHQSGHQEQVTKAECYCHSGEIGLSQTIIDNVASLSLLLATLILPLVFCFGELPLFIIVGGNFKSF